MGPRNDREHLLPRFSLDRRVTVLVLLATALVVGGVATVGIPLELLPRGYDAPSLTVRAVWSQSPSQEMLDKVTLPLEEELGTVSGLQDLFSFATTGFTRVAMSFKLGTDMDVAYREVRDRVERAKARMPDEVERVMIHKQDTGAIPVVMLGMTVDPQLADPHDLIQSEVVLPVERLDGVASIESHGLEQKEVLIELDKERTAAAGLNIYQLGQELANDNFTLASGHVYAGGRKLLLRSVAKYPDVEALRNRLMAPSVRLGDVATVKYEEPEKNYRVRVESLPAVALFVFKEGDANSIEVADAVIAEMEKMSGNPRLSLIEITPLFDQGETIRESLRTLLSSGAVGGVIAFLVLFFFLRRVRLTLIIALAIPLSVLIGLTAMYFFGETLNILSLLGLMISVGLLVDNSVVVAENVFRLHRDGHDRRTAAIRGAGEISLAILMATLTTIIVFLPVSLVEGQGQFFLLRLAIPITTSLLGSLLVALVFVPLATYLTLPRGNDEGGGATAGLLANASGLLRRSLRRLYDRTLLPLNRAYVRMLGFFLHRRLDLTLAIVAVIAVSAALPFREVELVQQQEEERGIFEIRIDFPQSTTLEEATDYFDQAERYLEAHKDELDLDSYFIFHRSTSGQLQGWFNSPRTNDLSPREVIERVQAALPDRAGVKTYTGVESDDERESKAVEVLTLYGEDAAQLETLAEELEGRFLALDGVLGVKQSSDRPAEEMALRIDRERTQRLDLNPEAVAGVVRYSLGGRSLPEFYRDGREIPVRVRFQEEDRESLRQLQDFGVMTGGGEVVSLQAVTRAERLDAPQRIFRRNRRVARTITLELEEGREEEARDAIRQEEARIDLPEGVRFGAARRGPSAQESENQAMFFAMGLSVIFIYLLMGFLFESFILPLSIVTSIPLAAIGVYWIHYLAGYDLDGLGLVGIVLLIGVVVNNGIVLVDYVNRLRAEGRPRSEALRLAADRRFRPIMMTALTTIGGMVPLALSGTTSIGLSYTSFGLTLIGGMTSATLLTLLVVPVAYTLFDDLGRTLASTVHSRATAAPSRIRRI